MEPPCLAVFQLRSICHSWRRTRNSLGCVCGNYFSERVNHKPAVSEINFSKDVSKKVWSSAQIPKEEATAGEAAARRRNIWKLWETLIQVGQRDAVCLPCQSLLGQLHRKAVYEIREVATPGVDEVWSTVYWSQVWVLVFPTNADELERVQINENSERLVAVRNS